MEIRKQIARRNYWKKNEAQINELQRIKSIKETQVKQDDNDNIQKNEPALESIIVDLYKNMKIQNEIQNKKFKDLERKLECHKKDAEKQKKNIKKK